jgi:hypothetical protein
MVSEAEPRTMATETEILKSKICYDEVVIGSEAELWQQNFFTSTF